MKNLKIILALFLFAQVYLYSFPDTLELNSGSGNIIYSDTTELGKNYYITVSGTYSMWPSFDSYGVDGAYLYDVPREEIDALRWPPEIIEIFGQEYELYDLPMWLGTNNEIPPADLDIPGLNIRIVSREHIGLRVDGNWLENTGYNPSTHTYKLKIKGTGNPIAFQILDSSYSISQNRIVPRYEDNSGSLNVIIEEDVEINICDLKVLCDEETGVYGIQLSAAIFEYYDENGQPINMLKNMPPEKMGIAMNGNFICPDSINCSFDDGLGISWCFVFDNSGSMDEMFGEQSKLSVLKQTTNKFIDKFTEDDEGMLITFNSIVDIAQEWTADKEELKNKVNGVIAGGSTAYFDGAYIGVENTFKRNNPNKVLILLSDGGDNSSFQTQDSLINYALSKQIPIYTIGVSLEAATTQSMMDIANLTGGKYYPANDPNALEEVFESIQDDVSLDDCCQIYFKIPDEIKNAEKPLETDVTVLYFDKFGDIKSKDILITIPDTCYTETGMIEKIIEDDTYLKIYPVPADNQINLMLEGEVFGNLQIDIFNQNGIKMLSSSFNKSGIFFYDTINTTNLSSGTYILRLKFNDYEITEKFIIYR